MLFRSQYRLSDVVNVTSSQYSLECVSYTGTTGADEDVSFEQYEYPIQSINDERDTFRLSGNQTFYFKTNDVVQGEYTEGVTYFVVESCSYNPNNDITSVKVKRYQDGTGYIIDPEKEYSVLIAVERGTKDGFILWSLVEDTEKVKYDWNSFVTFSHTLEIVE